MYTFYKISEKSPSKDIFFFLLFKFVIISFCTWKPNPSGLGNCSVLNFCKTSFRYFFSSFTGTLDKFVPYATGLFMSKKSKLLTREGWFRVFLKLQVENHYKITIFSTFYITDNFSSCCSRNLCKKIQTLSIKLFSK